MNLDQIELQIGSVQRSLGQYYTQKFIICRDSGSLVYHARVADSHYEVVKNAGIDKNIVVGGGQASFVGVRSPEKNNLEFYGSSALYGGVPQEVMERFSPQLLEIYREIDSTIQKIFMKTDCGYSLEKWLERIFEN